MHLEFLGTQVLPVGWQRCLEALTRLAEEDEAQRVGTEEPALAVRVLEDRPAQPVVVEVWRQRYMDSRLST